MQSILRYGVNAGEANVTQRVGSNVFAFELLTQLELITRDAPIEWTIFLPKTPIADLPPEREGWEYVVCPPSFLWTRWRLPLELYRRRWDFHAMLSLGHYAPRLCPYPQAVCVLDLAYLKFPTFFKLRDRLQLKLWTARSVRSAKHIFTISEHSKRDIVKHYKKKSPQVTVIYPGVPQKKHTHSGSSDILRKYELQKGKYIISVVTIQPRKNLVRAIQAFELLKTQDPELKLVFVGRQGWLTKEFDRALSASSVRRDIVVTGFVDEEVKAALLSNAGCSIMIGYYEGFGIPVAESLQVGVIPVIADAASLPEVAGKYGIAVNPYVIEEIAAGMKKALTTHVSAEMKEKMAHWVKQFSWEEAARTLVDTLQQKFGKR